MDNYNISKQNIKIIKQNLINGNLIAFPTETVFGIGGDATNNHSIVKIFKIKKRPKLNPLIIIDSAIRK